MLTVKERKTYLNYLGYYDGKINSTEDKALKTAYRALQEDYFIREKDIDGLYGPDTDKLLVDVYRVKKYTKNFNFKSDPRMKCSCGGKYCTGFPGYLDINLLKDIQKVRDKYGPTTITSGMRCKKYNDSIPGSSTTSRHMPNASGVCKAFDFNVAKNSSEVGRKVVVSYWMSLPKARYSYCNVKGSHPNMGSSVHGDVK